MIKREHFDAPVFNKYRINLFSKIPFIQIGTDLFRSNINFFVMQNVSRHKMAYKILQNCYC